MPLWLYAIGCAVVPAVWGVVMYWVFGLLGKRRLARSDEDVPPIDYSI